MGLATAEVYAEADRLGTPRGESELEAIRRRLRDAVDEGDSPLAYREHLVNDLQPAAISLRPEIEDALVALAEAGAAHAMVTGSGPTAFGLYPTADEALAAAEGPARAIPRGDGDRPARLVKGGRINWKWVRRGLLAAAIVAFFIFRGDLPHIDLEGAIQDLSKGLGAWTYLLVGALAFLETGAFVGLIAPGEFTVISRRRGRRAGPDLAAGDPGGHLGLRLRRGHRQLPARGEAGPRVPRQARQTLPDHRGAA